MSEQHFPSIAGLGSGQGIPIRNIICVGRNYAEHARELGNAVPSDPILFLKPLSAVVYSGGRLVIPRKSERVDHEVELVISIGKSGRNIPEKDAMSFVSGYAVGIDFTARDLQDRAKQKSLPWSVSKGFDTFAALSDFVSPARIQDPARIRFDLSVNGVIRQKGDASQMVFSVPQLISYVSTIFSLAPGDLIFTGTPQGVSPLSEGDRILARLEEGLSTLELGVIKETGPS